MKKVFLSNGQEADLIKEIDGKFLVAPYVMFLIGEDDWDSEPSENLRLVDKVYKTAPKENISLEYEEIKKKVKDEKSVLLELGKHKHDLFQELAKMNRQKMDLSKLIFDRSDLRKAKRLIVFKGGIIPPLIMDAKHDLKLSLEISMLDGKMRAWVYTFSYDSFSGGTIIDDEYGIMCDLTDEQIEILTKERVIKKKPDYFNDWSIKSVDDKWLPPEMITRKQNIITEEKRKEKEKLQNDLQIAQEKLSKLTPSL